MIQKTQRRYKRQVNSYKPNHKKSKTSSLNHWEVVIRETWWLLGIIPIYSRDTIITSTM